MSEPPDGAGGVAEPEKVDSNLADSNQADSKPADPKLKGPDDPAFAVALNYTWAWVESWRRNRHLGMQSYLLALALTSAAYVTALGNGRRVVAAAVGIVGVIGTVVAWQHDLRVRERLRHGQRPLAELERRLAEHVGIDSLRMDELAEQPRRHLIPVLNHVSVPNHVSIMYLVFTLLYAVGGAYALSPW